MSPSLAGVHSLISTEELEMLLFPTADSDQDAPNELPLRKRGTPKSARSGGHKKQTLGTLPGFELSSPPRRRDSNWTGTRKAALVVDILSGRTTLDQAMNDYGLDLEKINAWLLMGMSGLTQALSMPDGNRKYSSNEWNFK